MLLYGLLQGNRQGHINTGKTLALVRGGNYSHTHPYRSDHIISLIVSTARAKKLDTSLASAPDSTNQELYIYLYSEERSQRSP